MRAVALFLGAGFSKRWGLPLTRDLLPVSEEECVPIIEMQFPRRYQRQRAKKVRASWLKYWNECKGSVDQFAEKLRDDEQGTMGLPFNDLAYFLAMRLAIDQSVVREFNRQPQFTRNHIRMQEDILIYYDEVVKVLKEYSLRGIVTTNYDVVVEKILGPHTRGRLGGFIYGRQEQPALGKHQLSTQHWYGPESINGTIPLLKLHGSLNWAISDEGGIDVYVDCRPCLKRGLRPLIVPPQTDSRQNGVLSKIWQKASEVLNDADVWVFCGYSVPSYDKDVQELLISSASNLRRAVILSPQATTIEQRIRDILNASVPELEVKCGPGLGPEFTPLKFHSLISGNDSASE